MLETADEIEAEIIAISAQMQELDPDSAEHRELHNRLRVCQFNRNGYLAIALNNRIHELIPQLEQRGEAFDYWYNRVMLARDIIQRYEVELRKADAAAQAKAIEIDALKSLLTDIGWGYMPHFK